MDFSNSPTAGGRLDSKNRDELMSQLKMQLDLKYVTELLQKMSEKCFQKCVPKPGSSLDNSEQKCIAMCMDRYQETLEVVSKTFSSRLQREMSGW